MQAARESQATRRRRGIQVELEGGGGLHDPSAGEGLLNHQGEYAKGVTMERRVTGFHQDGEGHWVAELECGHNQHVWHDPPWECRP
jgi:hypothetical protein